VTRSETTHVAGLQLLEGLWSLRQGHHNDGHLLDGGMVHSHGGNGRCVLGTGRLIYLVTHHISVELEHVELAHGTGSVLNEPGIDAVFMELVPASTELSRHSVGGLLLTYLHGSIRMVSVGL